MIPKAIPVAYEKLERLISESSTFRRRRNALTRKEALNRWGMKRYGYQGYFKLFQP